MSHENHRSAPRVPAGLHGGMSFVGLIVHNLNTRRIRTLLTAFAVAISVMAVVTLGVVTASLKSSAAEVLSAGTSDFTVAQRGSSDVLTSVVTDQQVSKIAATTGVESAVGVLISTVRVDADHPLFLEIGVSPAALAPFGVRILAGRAYGAAAPREVMIGWQAAQDLNKRVGDPIVLDGIPYDIVGLYSTNQVFADTAAMFPLVTLQAMERKPGTVTLAVVKVTPGTSIRRVRNAIEQANPNLATVREANEFGRVDRNLQFLDAAHTGALIIALVIGVIVVMNTMLLSFVERIREFGLLRAVGWSRSRLLAMVFGEAIGISLLGAGIGVGLAFALMTALEYFSSLRGIFHAQLTSEVFATALYSAVAIGVIAALYPSARAALLQPGVALRRE
jgi:putative ABC transport system permease protein